MMHGSRKTWAQYSMIMFNYWCQVAVEIDGMLSRTSLSRLVACANNDRCCHPWYPYSGCKWIALLLLAINTLSVHNKVISCTRKKLTCTLMMVHNDDVRFLSMLWKLLFVTAKIATILYGSWWDEWPCQWCMLKWTLHIRTQAASRFHCCSGPCP